MAIRSHYQVVLNLGRGLPIAENGGLHNHGRA